LTRAFKYIQVHVQDFGLRKGKKTDSDAEKNMVCSGNDCVSGKTALSLGDENWIKGPKREGCPDHCVSRWAKKKT